MSSNSYKLKSIQKYKNPKQIPDNESKYPDKAGWYQDKNNGSSSLMLVHHENMIPGMIRFNTKLNPPQFQGYIGDNKWVGFNAQKGDKGEKGEDFGNLIKLVNGGKQEMFGNITFDNIGLQFDEVEFDSFGLESCQLFTNDSLNLKEEENIIKVRSLKPDTYFLNGNEEYNMELRQDDDFIYFKCLPQPYKWDLTNKTLHDMFSNPDENSIFKAYGDIKLMTTAENHNVVRGQIVTTFMQESRLVIKPLTYTGMINSFRQNVSVFGVALQDGGNGESIMVCTRGITTVKISHNISTLFVASNEIESEGCPGLVSQDGFVFYSPVKPSCDYIKAGYFIESGIIASDNHYLLFHVN